MRHTLALAFLCATACTRVEISAPLAFPARVVAVSEVGRVVLHWDHVEGADGYVVYSALDPSIGPETAATIGSATTDEIAAFDLFAVFSPLPTGQDTYFAVAARFGSRIGPALPAIAGRPLVAPSLLTPSYEAVGIGPGDSWGDTLIAGDFDGDSRGDVAIGSPSANTKAGVFAIRLGGDGLTGAASLAGTPTAELAAGAIAADFDDDGDDDLIIGEPGENGGDGALTFIRGGPSFVDSGNIDGVAASNGFGCALATGDFDGDGDLDFAAGERGTALTGSIHLYRNLANGPHGPALFELASTIGSPSAAGAFGCVLDFADVDGDGFEDLLAGEPLSNALTGDNNEGRFLLWFGSAGGIPDGPADVQFSHGNGGDRTGAFVAGLGDLDGDGREEFAVTLGSQSGPRVQLYQGRRRDDLQDDDLTDGDPNVNGTQRPALQFDPMFAIGAGDLDGDGFGDILIGDRRGESTNGADDDFGTISIHFGRNPDGGGSNDIVGNSLEITDGGATGDGTGASAAVSDLDGDGWPEILVGEPGFDNVDANAGRMRSFRGGRVRGILVDPGDPLAGTPGSAIVPFLAGFDDRDPRAHTCEIEFGGLVDVYDPCDPRTLATDSYFFAGGTPGTFDLRIRVTAQDGTFGEARVRVEIEDLP